MRLQATAPVSLALLLGGLALSGSAAAGPTVAELLATCDRGAERGDRGLDAAACEWFAAPCACKGGVPDGGAPPWCLPDAEPVDAVVRRVVAALRAAPRDAPVEAEVERVLRRLYPCSAPPGR